MRIDASNALPSIVLIGKNYPAVFCKGKSMLAPNNALRYYGNLGSSPRSVSGSASGAYRLASNNIRPLLRHPLQECIERPWQGRIHMLNYTVLTSRAN